MRKICLALVAAGLLAVTSALPAAAAQKSEAGVTKSHVGSVDLSARRYYRGGYRGYRYGYYRGGPYYRPYYRPYYGYGPYYGYYRPAPFPFFPFF
jgi:hypothetical protein